MDMLNKFDYSSAGKKVSFIKPIPEEIIGLLGDEYRANPDGYVISADKEINVYSMTDSGLFYGAAGLDMAVKNNLPDKCLFYKYPSLPYRGVKVYLPARKDIGYFKEFVDFAAYCGFNKITIEVGGAMEYERHPEINSGWEEYCGLFSHYQGESLDIQNSPKWARNSIHCENGGGSFLTKKEVSDLVQYCKDRYFEVVPEMPSLSHCDYLLVNHPELKERACDDLPDTYCPSNPASYELLFDLLNEVIEVFNPKTVHIGHDELFSIGLCPCCRVKDAGELLAADIIKIHGFLKERGIKTAMWGDKLLNAIGKLGQTWGGSRRVIVNMKTGRFLEEVPATYHAIDLIPKDIQIYHWYWGLDKSWEKEFLSRGFETVLGNFSGIAVTDWEERRSGFHGVSISNWSALNLSHMQRNGTLADIYYSAEMLWNPSFREQNFEENVIEVSKKLYGYNLKSHKNYVEITHRTSVFKDHPPFVDGFMIDKEDDYLGKYAVTLDNGEILNFPVYYNLNIGTAKAGFRLEPRQDIENNTFDKQLFEPLYTCMLVKCEDEIYYKTAFEIPEGRRIKSVALIEDSKYKNNIEIKEIVNNFSY